MDLITSFSFWIPKKVTYLSWFYDFLDNLNILEMASKAAMVEVAYGIFDTYDENNSGYL